MRTGRGAQGVPLSGRVPDLSDFRHVNVLTLWEVLQLLGVVVFFALVIGSAAVAGWGRALMRGGR